MTYVCRIVCPIRFPLPVDRPRQMLILFAILVLVLSFVWVEVNTTEDMLVFCAATSKKKADE